jgi:hypothetical protein
VKESTLGSRKKGSRKKVACLSFTEKKAIVWGKAE